MNLDVERIRSTSQWPMYPFLPVKRPQAANGRYEFGIIVAEDLTRVFLLSIDQLPQHPYQDFEEMKKKHPSERFMSTEALVEAGWIVD